MATTIQVGQRVEAGTIGTWDHDAGHVVSVDADAGTATIAWDSGVRTETDIEGLRPESAEPTAGGVMPTDGDDLVLLETMPQQHRSSHRAAGNFGAYPHNGAERFVMPRVEAEEIVDSDEDGYDRILRDATAEDVRHYGTTRRPEGW